MQSTFGWKCSFESSLTPRSMIASVRVTEGSQFIGVTKNICFPTEGSNHSFAYVSFHEDSSALALCTFDIILQYSAIFSGNGIKKYLMSVGNKRCKYFVAL
jgi:hypothetical protein